MTLGWKTVKRPALTLCGLIVLSLLSAGCRLHSGACGTCFQRFVNPKVCPTCAAVSIEQCQCFPVTENAGYCETTWASLNPMMETLHDAPDYSYSEHVEEFSPPVPADDELAYSFELESTDLVELISTASPAKAE